MIRDTNRLFLDLCSTTTVKAVCGLFNECKIKASFHIHVVVFKTEQYNPSSSVILHGEE